LTETDVRELRDVLNQVLMARQTLSASTGNPQ
jgi:hypothetical protein